MLCTVQCVCTFLLFFPYFILFILSRLRALHSVLVPVCRMCRSRYVQIYIYLYISECILLYYRRIHINVYSIAFWRDSRIFSPWHSAAAMRFTLAYLRQRERGRERESAEFIDRLINHNSKSRKRNGFLFRRFSFSFLFPVLCSFAALTKRINILFWIKSRAPDELLPIFQR